MGFEWKRKAYEILPASIKTPFRWIPFGFIAGVDYRKTLARGRWLDRAGREEVRGYQADRLEELLRFVTDQVPAYRKFKGYVERHPPFDALKAFPIIDKAELQQNMHAYLPRDFHKIPHYPCTTGGTSGNQLRFYVDDSSQAVEMAFMHRQWQRVGYTPRDRKATFRGVEFGDLKRGVYWKENPVYNEMQFSPFHINAGTLERYWEELLRYRPRYLHGYPSAIGLLAELIRRQALPGTKLNIQGILLGSEAASMVQRELIQEVFGAKVFSWYGHSERVLLAGECEHGDAYHQFPDYGVLELFDDKGNGIEARGGNGELIGTGLLNRSLPLVRYRTGDYARLLGWQCPCGRAFDRFDQVEGRWVQEYVIGKNGSRISLAALNMHGSMFEKVIRYQYYQEEPGIMDLRVMVSEDFGIADEIGLIQAYTNKIGEELRVRVKVMEEIPLTPRGKLRRLVQAIESD